MGIMLAGRNIKISILKTLGFMSRLVIFIIFVGGLCTNLLYADNAKAQNIYDVQVRVSAENSTIQNIFSGIEEQTEFEFLYSLRTLQKIDKKFSYQYNSVTVADLLTKLSEDTGLWFWQLNSSISVGTKKNWPHVKTGTLICAADCPKPKEGKGALHGVIIDSMTEEAIFGATILMEGTSLGSATGIEGRFELNKLPSGNHQFTVRYLGYKTQSLAIEILADEIVEIQILLEPDVVEGEGIVVYSQAEGQAKAIREQIASTSVMNVVSESKIRELPDANAAESVGRLPGVSIIRDSGEGERITIRGLASRHNSITLDGDRIPSSDEDGRAVNLNMISPEMLSGIELYKSIRPDMDADAIGGSVNFKFAGVPEKQSARLSIGTGYSDHINSIGAYNGSLNASGRFLDNKIGVLVSLDAERNDRSSDSFDGSYEKLHEPRDGEEYATYATSSIKLRDKRETRDRLGAGFIVDVEIPGGKLMVNNFASRLNRDIINRTRSYDMGSFSQDHGMSDTESHTDILSSRISGEHNFGLALVEWRASRNLSEEDIPYDHSVDFEELGAFYVEQLDSVREGLPRGIPAAAKNNLEETEFAGSNFKKRNNRELDHSGQLDVTIPLRFGNQLSGDFKFGGKAVIKDRIRRGRDWDIRSGDGHFIYGTEDRDWIFTGSGDLSIQNYLDDNFQSRSDFLDGQYDMSVGIDHGEIQELWEIHQDDHIERLTIVFDDQNVTERIYATYGLTELNIGSRLIVLGGLRYEYTNSDYTAKKGQVSGSYRNQGFIYDTTATQKFGMFFPMIHLRYRVTDWFDVRVARTETISRPNFSELLPREEISANSRHVRRGSPELKPAEATNYDLFLTAYSNKLGLISVGGFYKRIDGLIYDREAVITDTEKEGVPPQTLGYELYEPFNNPNETEVKGIEVEWQSNFTYLPDPFNGLVFNANVSRIWTETQYPQFRIERTSMGIVGVDTFRVGPMLDQPELIANLSVGYDFLGFSVRVSMIYQEEYLSSIGSREETNKYVKDFLRWDAAFKYKFYRGLNIFLNLQNISNRPDQSIQFTDRYPNYMQYYGWTAEAGLRYDFFR